MENWFIRCDISIERNLRLKPIETDTYREMYPDRFVKVVDSRDLKSEVEKYGRFQMMYIAKTEDQVHGPLNGIFVKCVFSGRIERALKIDHPVRIAYTEEPLMTIKAIHGSVGLDRKQKKSNNMFVGFSFDNRFSSFSGHFVDCRYNDTLSIPKN